MASLLEIANSALDLVGQQQILSLDDPTAAARKANLHIRMAIAEVLGAARWTSAQKSAVLSQLSEPPAFGWAYHYQLPNDYISCVSLNEIDPTNVVRDLFEVRGRELFTDETEANLVYVCDLTLPGNDLGAASPLLAELFALKLATRLAWTFQQSRTLRESLLIEYGQKLAKAAARDAREGRRPIVNQLSESNWIRNRINSTDG